MILQYEIAGLVISINNVFPSILESMNEFLSDRSDPGQLSISLHAVDDLRYPEGKLVMAENFHWMIKPNPADGYFVCFPVEKGSRKAIILADIDRQWKNAQINYRNDAERKVEDNYSAAIEFYTRTLLGGIFRYFLIYHAGLVLHSSSIKWKGMGVAFTAPSGTGKSTHTRLWKEYLGREVIVLNDDTPAVRFINDRPVIFGTPWSGSSGIHSNDSAPLGAVVVLEQAPFNRMQFLNREEAALRLIAQIPVPYFDPDLTTVILNILDRIIACVPVYLLQCRPDRPAVELVQQNIDKIIEF